MTRADFNDLVRQLNRNLYGLAFRILRNQEEAEDAVQDVFIKLWNMGGKIDEYKSIGALAATMTKNTCIDLIRKKKHIVQEGYEGMELSGQDNSSPYELMASRESEDILYHIIDQLPEIYKEVIKLREIDGMTYEEIADKTKQNINTLRVTLSRARKMIREEFNKYQYERRGTEEVNRKVL
ncbi:MAG TPA: RNA polymerase sigma factor [Bacteroidales bacterium]